MNSISSTTGVGTTGYMAPEQFLNKTFGLNGTISNRTDIWAAGIILYRMLTGNFPFGGRESQGYEALLEEITQTEPDYNHIPAKFLPVIKGCLQKKAADRFADAEAALKALETINASPQSDDGKGTIVVPRQAAPKFSQPNPVKLPDPAVPTPVNNKTIAMIAVAVTVAAIVFYFISGHHSSNNIHGYGDTTTKDTSKMNTVKMDSAKMTDTSRKMTDTSRKITGFSKPADKAEKRTSENVEKQGDDTTSKSNGAVNTGTAKSFSFFDGFSDNSNSWPVVDDSTKIIRIANGNLTIQGSANRFSYRSLKYFYFNPDENFDFFVLAKWINGINENDFGIEFGSNPSSGFQYRFCISADGFYHIIYRGATGDWKDSRKSTKSDYINRDNRANTLGIQRRGDNISFFVNNHNVVSLRVNKALGHYFGVACSGAQTVDFDNFYIKGSK